jgi:hypothetical protein
MALKPMAAKTPYIEKHIGTSRRMFCTSVGLLPLSFSRASYLPVPEAREKHIYFSSGSDVRALLSVALVQTVSRVGYKYIESTIKRLKAQINNLKLIIFQPSRALVGDADIAALHSLADKYQCYLIVGHDQHIMGGNFVQAGVFGPSGYFISNSQSDSALKLFTEVGELLMLTGNSYDNNLGSSEADIVIDFRNDSSIKLKQAVSSYQRCSPFLIRMPPAVNMEGACIFDNFGVVLTQVGPDWEQILTANLDLRQSLRQKEITSPAEI